MTRIAAIIGFVLIALAAVPASASAERGWKLPTAKSKHGGRVFKSVAWHCGQRPFGVYRFKNRVRLASGRRGYVIFRVRLTRNGVSHKPRFRRFGGHLPRRLKKRTRRVLRRTRWRYVASGSPVVESRWRNGRLQATRPFNPVRTRRARC